MSVNIFKQKVRKQLWFLTKKEKKELNEVLERVTTGDSQVDTRKPIRFSNQFLKEYIFKEKVVSFNNLLPLLLGILFTYILLIGVFIFGFLASLSSVQYFIKPEVQLTTTIVILTFIGSILLIIISLYCFHKVTAYFTKKLLEYRHNRNL
ncbi:hypothetical protein [Staphylococcus durrellii]|uniref:hypothetical protein n=1 Tax=Staphylococcus durrellii TaxID=2781773 RepID=UPI00189E6693|nr:hypothetical protein [Staphylococcus durrellii]MBF7016798.1 hypothetical protein [Staphylococcus durrellii]